MEQGSRLSFVRPSERKTGDGHKMAWYRCQCGAVVEKPISRVSANTTRSCGCLGKEISSRKAKTHGWRYTPEYASWRGMKARCRPGNKDFHRYGAKGISVCPEWEHSFEAFIAHIGPRPEGTNSVDRIDYDKGYCPGNVRWANPHIQARNRRDLVVISTVSHGDIALVDYAQHLGISKGAAHHRLRRGKLEGLHA